MRRILSIYFIVMVAIFCPTTSTLAENPIRIALLTDLSNIASYYGHQTRLGALLAEQELKSEGKNVEIIIEDSALNTAQALSATQKLLHINNMFL